MNVGKIADAANIVTDLRTKKLNGTITQKDIQLAAVELTLILTPGLVPGEGVVVDVTNKFGDYLIKRTHKNIVEDGWPTFDTMLER